MKLLKRFAFAAVALLTLSMASCSGSDDNDTTVGPAELQKLTLKVDKQIIAADGVDRVALQALYGSKNVIADPALAIYVSLDGGAQQKLSTATEYFATTTAGSYTFTATYTVDERVVECENEVVVTATPTDIEIQEYMRKVLCMQFTSTGCQNCPVMSTYMKDIKEVEFPGRVAVASFHTDYGQTSDPMAISTTKNIMNRLGFNGLPHFVLDFHPDMQSAAYKDNIVALIGQRLQAAPKCGVAIDSDYDAQNRKLSLHACVTASEEASFRYIVMLVEDGIRYYQMGVEGDDAREYTHNNVVRALLTSNLSGEMMNSGKPFTPGVEVKGTRSITLEEDWNVENMRIIAIAMHSEDEITYSCENLNECRVGESVDYYTK